MSASLLIDTEYFSELVGEDNARLLFQRAELLGPGGEPPVTLDMITFWRLCAENIRMIDDESHGVAVAKVPRGSLSVLIRSAKEADDLSEALDRLVETARFIRKECVLSLSRGRGVVRLTLKASERADRRTEIYLECFIIVIHCALRWMTAKRLDPVRVRGAACLKDLGGELLMALHAPVVRRGEGVSIDYHSQDMTARVLEQKYNAWGEAEFGNFVALLGQDEDPQETAGGDVDQVLAALRAGRTSQEEVARDLKISAPTLRRRLSASGYSFRQLLAEHRSAMLRNLLATDLDLADIAERVGLSDDRSLRRFCAEHLGGSPARLRRAG